MDKLARKSHDTPELTKAPTHEELCRAQEAERVRQARAAHRRGDR